MPKHSSFPISMLVIVLLMIGYSYFTVSQRWTGDNGMSWKEVHRSDVKGYYGYLRAVFINHDLGHEAPSVEFIHEVDGHTLNKYFCGTSVMMMPWFLIGHGIAHLTDAPTDGLSAPYLKSISAGALIYALLAFLLLRILLLRLPLSESDTAWVIGAFGAGTILIQYATMQPGWTHIYSFVTICAFFVVMQLLQRQIRRWHWIASGLLFGLIVLIRPVNGLILLGIPVIWGSETRSLVQRILRAWPQLIIAIGCALLVLAIQPLLWYAQTGRWLEWSYRGEGFYWTDPSVLEVLFSFRRGLFLYTPLLVLPLLCVVVIWRAHRTRAIWSLLYWVCNTYVISAWWIWDYGGGFGQRPFIDHYPIMAIGLGLGLVELKRHRGLVAKSYILVATVFFLLQFVQYQRNIISNEYMDYEKYAFVFMRFDPALQGCLGGSAQMPPYHPNGMDVVLDESAGPDLQSAHWSSKYVTRSVDGSEASVCELSLNTPYSTTLRVADDVVPVGRPLYLEVSLTCFEPVAGASKDALVVVEIKDALGLHRYYDPSPMNPTPGQKDGVWRTLEYSFQMPALERGEALGFYVWNQGPGIFQVRELHARLHAVRDH